MKQVIIFLTLLALLPITCIAEDNNRPVLPEQTTEKEIRFLTIPWNTDINSVTKAIETSNVLMNKKEVKHPNESYNFHDGSPYVFPYLASKHVKTTVINYDCSCTVAGYEVDGITLSFMDEEKYGFYKAEYRFSTSSYFKPKNYTYVDQYEDLKQKLTNLYGKPYEYEGSGSDFVGGIQEGKRSVWKGSNSTGVILDYDNHIGGILDGITSLRLTYGTGEVDRIFIEKNAIKELEEEQERQKQLEEIHNDNSGL